MRLIAIAGVLAACHVANPRPAADSDDLERLVAATAETDERRPELDFRLADELERRARAAHDAAPLRDRELAIYRHLVGTRGWASYARIDEVEFWYAHALAASGHDAESAAMFNRLLRDHPASKLRVDALIALADGKADHGDPTGALVRYREVPTDPRDPRSWYARYRIGWCYFDLHDYRHAVDELVGVAVGTRPGQEPGVSPDRSDRLDRLGGAARSDLVKVFGATDEPAPVDDARAAFAVAAGGDGELARRMLGELARTFCTQGRIDACIAAYGAVPSSCPSFDALARALHGNLAEVIAIVDATPGTADAACRARTAALAGAIAMTWHREGTARNDQAQLDAAQALYAADLRRFPGAPEATTATYFAAELYYARANFCAAAPLYATVARTDDTQRDEAAYAHMLATLACEHLTDTTPPASETDTPQPIPAAWQHVIAAMALFLERSKASAELATARFRRARILYGFAHLTDAATDFRALVRGTTDGELASAAALLLLDCDQRTHDARLAADLAAACARPAKTEDLAAVCAASKPRR